MKISSVILASLFTIGAGLQAASGQVLYRETFGINLDSGLPSSGDFVLSTGWTVIESRESPLTHIVSFELPGGAGTVNANSGAIFAGPTPGTLGYTPDGDIGGGVNNNPVAGENFNGMIFASAGFDPFLFITESEVPAGTQSSDVGSIRVNMRNNFRNGNPQQIHPVLKVDGKWWVNEQFTTSGDDNVIWRESAIDLDNGLWAPMQVSAWNPPILDQGPDIADIVGAFDQPKPMGTVEGWGVYNPLLTANTRIDFIEFRSDNLAFPPIPEPGSVTLMALGVAGLGIWRLRHASR